MTMKIIAKMLLLVVLVVPVAYAQGPLVAGVAPVLEAGAGYTYTYAGVPGQTDKLAMNGVQVVGDADFSRRLGVQLDLGYSRNFDAYNSDHTADLLTYMAGPVFYPLRTRRVTVFAHVLLGGARGNGRQLRKRRADYHRIHESICVGRRRRLSIPSVALSFRAVGRGLPADLVL